MPLYSEGNVPRERRMKLITLATVAIIISGTGACKDTVDESKEAKTTRQFIADQDPVEKKVVTKLGRVHFETSCNANVRTMFSDGLARLHHMAYASAREASLDGLLQTS